MNEQNDHSDFSFFIRESVRQLKTEKFCYCYNLEQIEQIQKNFKVDLHIEKNECGFTLSLPKRKERK